MNYRSAVAEGKRLLKRTEDDDWALARLSYRVVTEEKLANLTQWAKDLGVSKSHAQNLRRVWERYGEHHGVRGARTFPEYYALAQVSEERAERLQEVADQTGLSITTVHRSMGYGDRVEAARALLGDRRVAEDVLRDPKTRATLTRATRSVDEDLKERAAERGREQNPKLANQSVQYEVIGELTSIRYRLNRMLERMTHELKVNKDVRESVLEVLEELENSVSWIRSFLESGDRSFEDALEQILSEGR